MPEYPWQPGMTVTAARLRESSRVGGVIFSAFRAAAQTITAGTENAANAISWDTPQLDALAGWSSSAPTRWTCVVPGWYTFDGAAGFNSNATGTTRDVLWFFNGSLVTGSRNRSAIVASAPTIIDARTFPRLMAVGDYAQLVPAHDATTSVATTGGSLAASMSVTYSGPA